MTQKQPITPPDKLIHQWIMEATEPSYVPTQAARWGADQELEACINYFHEYDPSWGENSELITGLRSWRRPKLPSLKEQALALISHDPENQPFLSEEGIAIIRRALESLPE